MAGDLEQGPAIDKTPLNKRAAGYSAVLSLAYQSLGVVYGDLSTSPLYVYKCTFSSYNNLARHAITEDEILGVLSFIFWTLTLIPLLKYVFIVLNVDDNGEGGTFALYSLLCRHAKLSLIPNQQEADEEVSTYKVEKLCMNGANTNHKAAVILSFLESNYRVRVGLLVVVLLGTCMVIGDGVVTPSISVLSAVSGINPHYIVDNQCFHVLFTCIILVGLFSLQQYGTHRVAFLFAPIVILWLLSISSIGVYNVIQWNPTVFRALSPYYMYKFFCLTGVQHWLSFGGIALCLTGAEAMFANLGHFSPLSIKIAFTGGVYPCLVLSYMGQAAFLTKNQHYIQQSFYKSLPESVYWPVVVVATLASIVASQSVISATFSTVNQCKALGCFPHVKVVHTSKDIRGQIYIPEINWMLMLLSLSITVGFKDTNIIGNAYGLAVTTVMLVTTFLMSMVVLIVWRQSILYAISLLVFFGSVEGIYFSASLIKVPRGGWVPLVLALIFMAVMCVWHYGTTKKYEFEVQNKVSMKRILSLGPSLGLVRVPGIGLVYSNLVTGIPGVFSHFITNIPAFHRVLVFVCIKSVPVPHVPLDERFLIGRIGPKMYRMFRCIVRYGYKDVQGESQDFEEMLVGSIEDFIRKEKGSANASRRGRINYTTNRDRDSSPARSERAMNTFGASVLAINANVQAISTNNTENRSISGDGLAQETGSGAYVISGDGLQESAGSGAYVISGDGLQESAASGAYVVPSNITNNRSINSNAEYFNADAISMNTKINRNSSSSSSSDHEDVLISEGGDEEAYNEEEAMYRNEEEEEEELWEVKEAKEAGVAYVLGRSIVKASRSSSLVKRVAINKAFSFLKENCRSPALALHVPHPCLIQVGMVCYV